MTTVSHTAPPSATGPRPPATIIAYLGGPLCAWCTNCRKPVAIRWIPDDAEFASWAGYQDVLFNYCHRCVLDAAQEPYRATLKTQFAHILQVRSNLQPVSTPMSRTRRVSCAMRLPR